jgi:hypothetical protein
MPLIFRVSWRDRLSCSEVARRVMVLVELDLRLGFAKMASFTAFIDGSLIPCSKSLTLFSSKYVHHIAPDPHTPPGVWKHTFQIRIFSFLHDIRPWQWKNRRHP